MPDTFAVNPADIYAQVARQIETVAGHIGTANFNGLAAEEMEAARASALAQLQAYKQEMLVDLGRLHHASEWDVFTIALYGETNAGKSTIIETLRILFQEPEKIAQRARFHALAQDTRLEPDHLALLQAAESQALAQLEHAEQAQQARLQDQHALIQAAQHSCETLEAGIAARKAAMGILTKAKYWFVPLAEETQLHATRLRQQARQRQIRESEGPFQAHLDTLAQRLAQCRKARQALQASHEALNGLQDGAIIGNGRSDFTRQAHTYCFEANGQQFALIDVPGIEGQENEVRETILSAVKKAHAVFYITPKAAPPNRGDDGSMGTLEKIRAHLGDQSEVWSIFNKRITNPQALQRDSLVDADEAQGLLEMEARLREQLGEGYRHTISLSALPAFYAVADCLLPDTAHFRARQKFRDAMTPAQLLRKSHFQAFCDFIRSDICQGHQEKIRQANIKKIRSMLERGSAVLASVTRILGHAAQDLEKQLTLDVQAIEAIRASACSHLRAAGSDVLDQARTQLRQGIHEDIQQNIGNDAFKRALRQRTQASGQAIVAAMEQAMAPVLRDFQQQVHQLAQRSLSNADEILARHLSRPFKAGIPEIKLKFKLRRNVKAMGLLSTLAGVAAMAWNPAGWVLAAIGAATVMLGLYNSMRGMFSSSHRQAQQRKAADENINHMFTELRSSMDAQLGQLDQELEQITAPLPQSMAAPLATVRVAQQVLAQARRSITNIAASLP